MSQSCWSVYLLSPVNGMRLNLQFEFYKLNLQLARDEGQRAIDPGSRDHAKFKNFNNFLSGEVRSHFF